MAILQMKPALPHLTTIAAIHTNPWMTETIFHPLPTMVMSLPRTAHSLRLPPKRRTIHLSPLFDTKPPSEADEEEISDAAVPEATVGVAGSNEFTESTEFPTGVSDLVQLKLCNLLHSIDAPLGAFPLFKQWAAEAQMLGHNFQEDADKKYVTYVSSLSKRLGLDYLKHKMVNVNVPWGVGSFLFPCLTLSLCFSASSMIAGFETTS
jgi:hypothetical protein